MAKSPTQVDDSSTAQNKTILASENVLPGELKRKFVYDDSSSEQPLPKELKDMFGPLKCELCCLTFSDTGAPKHYDGKLHKRSVFNYLKTHSFAGQEKNIKLELTGDSCTLCQVVFTSASHRQQHLIGKKHKKRRLFSCEAKIESFSPADCDSSGRFGIEEAEKEVTNENKGNVTTTCCSLCYVTTTSAAGMKDHLNGATHKKSIAEAAIKNKVNVTANYCSLCYVTASSAAGLKDHLNGAKHKMRMAEAANPSAPTSNE